MSRLKYCGTAWLRHYLHLDPEHAGQPSAVEAGKSEAVPAEAVT